MIVECIDDRKYSHFEIGELYVAIEETKTCFVIDLQGTTIESKFSKYRNKKIKVSKKCFVKIEN